MNSESETQNSKFKIQNSASADALVEVRGLKKYFPVTSGAIARRVVGWVKAVDDVSFSIRRGETLGLVGESGCGKTTTGRCVIQLERPTAGSVLFEGRDLVALSAAELRPLRRRMQIVFQDPYSSLNPRMTIGQIIAEPIRVHGLDRNGVNARDRVAELLKVVGINPVMGRRARPGCRAGARGGRAPRPARARWSKNSSAAGSRSPRSTSRSRRRSST